MHNVIHFEIEARDPQASIHFYQTVFGWRFEAYGDNYWLIRTGGGSDENAPISGGLMPGESDTLRTINTISVPSLEAALEQVQAAGGHVTSPTMEVPGVGLFAYCTDSQGLAFGLMQLK